MYILHENTATHHYFDCFLWSKGMQCKTDIPHTITGHSLVNFFIDWDTIHISPCNTNWNRIQKKNRKQLVGYTVVKRKCRYEYNVGEQCYLDHSELSKSYQCLKLNPFSLIKGVSMVNWNSEKNIIGKGYHLYCMTCSL